MGTTPISTLGIQVANRLEENTTSPVFWSLSNEFYTGLIEACNDFLILVGRPDFLVNQPFTLVPNQVWQTVPKGQLLITDIQGPYSPLWKVSLFSMDYEQSNNGPSWESDTSSTPLRWGPVGFSSFFIHPAVNIPTEVTITSIAYPTSDNWPYSGSETVPFHDEIFQWLEEYASHYARLKEGGAEFKESMALYQAYLQGAQRMTQIEDRKDPLIFSRVFGGTVGLNPVQKR
jgi:hypothetical protein